MESNTYYLAYEERYRKVFGAGVERWGHSPDDALLLSILQRWVNDNNLRGKRVIEFACGEGACGLILSKIGCGYRGVDIAPSAVEKAKAALKDIQTAKVSQLDMVHQSLGETFDAALDVMGIHMLVTDADRINYLKNVYDSLISGSPVLFFRESYSLKAYEGKVDNFEEWKAISCCNYNEPEKRIVKCGDKEVEVFIPLVPARTKSKSGYIREFQNAGFVVDKFIEMNLNHECPFSASIFAHKP